MEIDIASAFPPSCHRLFILYSQFEWLVYIDKIWINTEIFMKRVFVHNTASLHPHQMHNQNRMRVAHAFISFGASLHFYFVAAFDESSIRMSVSVCHRWLWNRVPFIIFDNRRNRAEIVRFSACTSLTTLKSTLQWRCRHLPQLFLITAHFETALLRSHVYPINTNSMVKLSFSDVSVIELAFLHFN